jgi:hypothetical protein
MLVTLSLEDFNCLSLGNQACATIFLQDSCPKLFVIYKHVILFKLRAYTGVLRVCKPCAVALFFGSAFEGSFAMICVLEFLLAWSGGRGPTRYPLFGATG